MIVTNAASPQYPGAISGISGWTYGLPGGGSDHGLGKLVDFGDPGGNSMLFINNWGRTVSQATPALAQAGYEVTARVRFGTLGMDGDGGRAGTFFLVAGEADPGSPDRFSSRSRILRRVLVGNPGYSSAKPEVLVGNRVFTTLTLKYAFAAGDPALGLPLTVAFRTEMFSVGMTYWDDASLVMEKTPVVGESPTITVQPQPVTVTEGQTAVLSVTATGTAPLTYQWQRNGVNMNGGTGATLTLPIVQLADAGDYRVVVVNPIGSATSGLARLTVNPAPVAPTITVQPQPLTVTAGQTAVFSVTATGTPPLRYRWERNGVEIPGAIEPVFTLNNAQVSDSGDYRVEVGNGIGNVSSPWVTLTVRAPGSYLAIALEPVPQVSLGSQADRYYVLYTGPAIDQITQPVDLRLGNGEALALQDPTLPSWLRDSATSRFYRVEAVDRTQPRDLDGDGLDDLYEVGYQPRLNPLDPADATLDPDRDGVSTRVEYAQRTDPFVANPPPAPASPVLVTEVPPSTRGQLLTLSGTGPRNAYVRVEGGAALATNAISGDGSFTLNVPLGPNRLNRLMVSAVATNGAVSPLRPLEILQDSQPPTVFADFPEPGVVVYEDRTLVAGRVGDSLSGYNGLFVWVHSSPSEGASPLVTTQYPTNSPYSAAVDVGIGPNGTFERGNVPLALGTNRLSVIATDALGNRILRQLTVVRRALEGPRLTVVAGDQQMTNAQRTLGQPLQVRVTRADGTPLAATPLLFEVTRSDGRVRPLDTNQLTADWTRDPSANTNGSMRLELQTDSAGEARVWWTLGSDAGCANNRVCVMATGVSNTVFFCASAQANTARQLNLGSGNLQKVEVLAPVAEPLRAWASDGLNPAPGVPVTFRVVRGGGRLVPGGRDGRVVGTDPGPSGAAELTVATGVTGHASVGFVTGEFPGENLVEASFPGQSSLPVVFTAYGLRRDPTEPGDFTGLVLDNTSSPIGNATVRLVVANYDRIVMSDRQGQFRLTDVPAGAGHLYVNGATATSLFTNSIPTNSFPALGYAVVTVANAKNSLPTPVLLPRLDPTNARVYYGTNDLTLTCKGIDGLKFTIQANSMRHPDGARVTPDRPAVVSLNQVHHDNIPMPMPDGVAPPFAWTFQPGGAHFDAERPVKVEYPNMSGLAPGSVAYFLSFNHDTERFEIGASGHVSSDGSTITTDPGSGLTISGWGCNCPPYSVSGECVKCDNGISVASYAKTTPEYRCVDERICFVVESKGDASFLVSQPQQSLVLEKQTKVTANGVTTLSVTFLGQRPTENGPAKITFGYGTGNSTQTKTITVEVIEVLVGARDRSGKTISSAQENQYVKRSDPMLSFEDEKPFTDGLLFSGKNNGVGDFVRFSANTNPKIPPSAIKSYRWRAEGGETVSGPEGGGASEWKIGPPGITWNPGPYRVVLELTLQDGGTCEGELPVDVGWRSPNVLVVGWIDSSAIENITLAPEVKLKLEPVPNAPPVFGISEDLFTVISQVGNDLSLGPFMLDLSDGELRYFFGPQIRIGKVISPAQPDDARQYINTYLIRKTANEPPPTGFSRTGPGGNSVADFDSISGFINAIFEEYRAINWFQIEATVDKTGTLLWSKPVKSEAWIGRTPRALFGAAAPEVGETGPWHADQAPGPKAYSFNGRTVSTAEGSVSLVAQGRVGRFAQAPWQWLNARTVPWIFGLIEFNPGKTSYTVHHEIFPSYAVYLNGVRQPKLEHVQKPVETFIQLGQPWSPDGLGPAGDGGNVPSPQVVTVGGSRSIGKAGAEDSANAGLWNVAVGAAQTQVRKLSEFRLGNVSAPDLYNNDSGPGSLADFISDDPLRVVASRTVGGRTEYAFSEFFHVRQGALSFVGPLTFTDVPPRKPEKLSLVAPANTLTLNSTNALRVVATYADGTTNLVTRKVDWTSYRLSNPALADLSVDGVLVPRRAGVLYVTAVNEAATAVIGLNLTEGGSFATVLGRLLDTNGLPVAGAIVSITGAVLPAVQSGSDGWFRVEGIPTDVGALGLSAFIERGENSLFVGVNRLTLAAGGSLDLGELRMQRGLAGLAWIPPGTFLMGSPSTEPSRITDETQHEVVLTQGFFMGRHEVTQAEYQVVMTNNPSSFKGTNLPVETVTWTQATNYCARLTERERLLGRLPEGWEYRLPTEAQWEYACRAGTTTATAFGNSLSSTQANFNGRYPYNGGAVGPYLNKTTRVGSYAPNAWGLYDMHGNVWEWCADWYGPYPTTRVQDPQGPPTGDVRVLRGGSWSYDGFNCRSAFRYWYDPGNRSYNLGFRVVLVRVR